jgi:hypothetical protein
MKKCPPGVICIENVSMFFIIVCLFIIVYLVYNSLFNNTHTEKIVIKAQPRENVGGGGGWFSGLIPSYPYNNLPSDPLLNPYAPPLRDERYFIPSLQFVPPNAVPINVSTNVGAVDTNYRQMGILTPLNGKTKDNILPLMGRPLFTNRDKWNYYSTSNQHNNVKLPVSRNGKSCTNEYGCDRLFNGDTVYLEGINEAYKATIYDNDTIKYLPFL